MRFSIFSFLNLTIILGCTSIPREFASDQNNTDIVLPLRKEDPQSCEIFQKKLPPELQQGYITTVEKTNNTSRAIKIFYYGKWRTTPLIIINGGPGMSSWATYEKLKSSLEKEKVEYLFFDQKGTGCSSTYPALDKEHIALWKNYSSQGLAFDIELIRKTLKLGDKISVFGQSFGSKVAMQYGINFPQSTHAVLFYGDSFVGPESSQVELGVATLQRQQLFLQNRILRNPTLKDTLQSLEHKFKNKPCAVDAERIISACGFDLIRDFGHYYQESTAEKIENILHMINNPITSENALREGVFNYTYWKMNPSTLLLAFLDYRVMIDRKTPCDLAIAKLKIESWALNSCAMAKYRLPFLIEISQTIQPKFLTEQEVATALKQHPRINFYQFESAGDLLASGADKQISLPKNWKRFPINGVDHFDYYKSDQFWKILKRATSLH